MVVDLLLDVKTRIICLYRSFRPQGKTPDELFATQLGIIKKALTSNCYVLGDFNLDAKMENLCHYNYKTPLCNLANFALEHNLSQVINFCTWSRTINGVEKESLLGHVYVNKLASVKNVYFVEPTFGGPCIGCY